MIAGFIFVSTKTYIFFLTSFFIGSSFDALGGVLQPMSANGQINNVPTTTISNHSSLNNNSSNNSQQTTTSTNGLLTGDLESSLASLAENLTINNRAAALKWVPNIEGEFELLQITLKNTFMKRPSFEIIS